MSVDQISFITGLIREALQVERDAPPKVKNKIGTDQGSGGSDTFTLALPDVFYSVLLVIYLSPMKVRNQVH